MGAKGGVGSLGTDVQQPFTGPLLEDTAARRAGEGFWWPPASVHAKPAPHRTRGTAWHAGENRSPRAPLPTHLTVGRKRGVGHGRVHHSLLLEEKQALLVLAQVRPGRLQLRGRRGLLRGWLRLGRLRLRRLRLDVGHQGVFVGVGHGGRHSRTQVRTEVAQGLRVAVGEDAVLFV